MLVERLRNLRKEHDFTQQEIADLLGIKRTTYTMYENGKNTPDMNILAKLSKIYHVSTDYILGLDDTMILTGEENRLLDLYRNANSTIREIVLFALKTGNQSSYNVVKMPTHAIDYYFDHPVSAGRGNFINDTRKETLLLKKEPPVGAAYVICISGDSMEDEYHNGDKIFISPAPPKMGEVGIFLYENEAYIKKLGDHELISLNPKYQPIKITNPDTFFCIGTVLGMCGEDYIE